MREPLHVLQHHCTGRVVRLQLPQGDIKIPASLPVGRRGHEAARALVERAEGLGHVEVAVVVGELFPGRDVADGHLEIVGGRQAIGPEGMVDERIVIPGLVDSTQLVTLTSEEALKYGIADTLMTNID